MSMYDDYDTHTFKEKDKTIKFLRNGNPNLTATLKVNKQQKFHDFIKQLEERLDIRNAKKFRLFNQEGVEIYEDDIEFIKDGSTLYVSKGEDFDQYSSFSEYEIVKLLGEGGFGKVLLGVHKVTKEKVAIKIVNTGMIGTAQDIDMVFREAELLKSLKHKNIVRILNCYTLGNMQVVFIMEYLEGGELLEYVMERERLSEEDARIFFIQIVDAMGYCHKEKLIHRDLKLENLLLMKKGEMSIKVIDFGIAGIATNFNVDSKDAGSFRYLAPEVLTGKINQIGPLVDVWAIGIILYGMVTGELPFSDTPNKTMLERITTGDLTFPPEKKITKECRDLIEKILNVDVSQRATINDILDHPWTNNKKLAEKDEEKKVNNDPKKPKEIKVVQRASEVGSIMKPAKSPVGADKKITTIASDKKPAVKSGSFSSNLVRGDKDGSSSNVKKSTFTPTSVSKKK